MANSEMKMFVDYKEFGKWVKETRMENGLTQRQFAETIDCTIEHLSKVENGHRIPSRLMAEDILEVLGYEQLLVIKKKEN